MAAGPWDSARGVRTGPAPVGEKRAGSRSTQASGTVLIPGLSVGPLGRVDFSSENPRVSPGLLPLGLAWGEPGMGGIGLHGLGGYPEAPPLRSHVYRRAAARNHTLIKKCFHSRGR